jgi:hypothetical protein
MSSSANSSSATSSSANSSSATSSSAMSSRANSNSNSKLRAPESPEPEPLPSSSSRLTTTPSSAAFDGAVASSDAAQISYECVLEFSYGDYPFGIEKKIVICIPKPLKNFNLIKDKIFRNLDLERNVSKNDSGYYYFDQDKYHDWHDWNRDVKFWPTTIKTDNLINFLRRVFNDFNMDFKEIARGYSWVRVLVTPRPASRRNSSETNGGTKNSSSTSKPKSANANNGSKRKEKRAEGQKDKKTSRAR